jgi:hypothetical protein
MVTAVVLSLATPLMATFWTRKTVSTSILEQNVMEYEKELNTNIDIIVLANYTNYYYIYNYGSTPANITLIYIDGNLFKGVWTVWPNQVVQLSQFVGKISTSGGVEIEVNGIMIYE